jgi:hypothetical protein
METKTNILIYQTSSGGLSVTVDTKTETIWLSQKQISEIFETSSDNISLHLSNIYAE